MSPDMHDDRANRIIGHDIAVNAARIGDGDLAERFAQRNQKVNAGVRALQPA